MAVAGGAAAVFVASTEDVVFFAAEVSLLAVMPPFSLLATVAIFLAAVPSPAELAGRLIPATGSGTARFPVGDPAVPSFETTFFASPVAALSVSATADTFAVIRFA